MDTISCYTYWVKIYIAGDYDVARQICREFCMSGACVNISKVDYIYTMGEETGICVELINFPPFTTTQDEIIQKAERLADMLLEGLCQASYTIMTPKVTQYNSQKMQIKRRNNEDERRTPEGHKTLLERQGF